jgi:N-carbamoyl-L-amino-acid hydrolase
MSFPALWESLLPVGRDGGTGGYRRFSWTPADAACRSWFFSQAAIRRLRAGTDRNGNLWAWWDPPPAEALGTPEPLATGGVGTHAWLPGPGAIVTGSHLDSVPDGGAYDGPLGVVTGFAAIDALRERGRSPRRPVAVAAFTEEEGARFGVACLGSRLLAGVLDPARARALTDAAGTTLAAAMAAAGHDPDAMGPDGTLLAGLAAYVELHIEQGRGLDDLGAAVGLASGIWPHGRWRLAFSGRADHAGTTRLADRHDPMLPCAAAILAARDAAAGHEGLATIGKLIPEPGGVNGISARVTAWLDARAPDEPRLQALVGQVLATARAAATAHGVDLDTSQESSTPAVEFHAGLRDRLAAVLGAGGTAAPVLGTGAGHDAGVLAARVPAAMLFVRNPSGVSHSPAEHADEADCLAGVAALAAVLEDLACRLPGAPPAAGTRSLPGCPARGSGPACSSRRRAGTSPRSPRTSAPATARPAPRTWPASRCPGWPTRTRTRSTGRCAGRSRPGRARSGPGGNACTRWPGRWSRTATWRWPARCTRRWRWRGSPVWASSTTCTTRPAAPGTPTPTRWAGC